jgi:2-C-methyl-D-erythritol 4-phosphate cytidylyltransferase
MSKSWCARLPRDVGVVVVAAGSGRRFGGPVPKQYALLGGVPVLLHAIRPFVSHPDVGEVVIVLAAEDANDPPEWLAPLLGERLRVATGGAERMASVAAGLAALSPAAEVVLVHDGARPFPARAIIDGGIAAARRGHGALPALPVADTVKRADEFGRVLSTVERHGLWTVQTPQAFPRRVLERAHATRTLDGTAVTDDSALVERIGEPVELLPGSARNLKITTADDLALAHWYLEHA